jgi:3-hydroxyisobutyrate dehydrogenase-like beta-hydroxyacid dehydrogenase
MARDRKFGFVGIGNMGAHMARNLAAEHGCAAACSLSSSPE